MQPVTIEDTDVKEVPEVLVKVESIANQHPVWNLNQPNMKNLNLLNNSHPDQPGCYLRLYLEANIMRPVTLNIRSFPQ